MSDGVDHVLACSCFPSLENHNITRLYRITNWSFENLTPSIKEIPTEGGLDKDLPTSDGRLMFRKRQLYAPRGIESRQ